MRRQRFKFSFIILLPFTNYLDGTTIIFIIPQDKKKRVCYFFVNYQKAFGNMSIFEFIIKPNLHVVPYFEFVIQIGSGIYKSGSPDKSCEFCFLFLFFLLLFCFIIIKNTMERIYCNKLIVIAMKKKMMTVIIET
jgi:hypothetical protein